MEPKMTVDIRNDKRTYGFDEAIDLTGIGCYSIGLLVTLSLTLLAMSIDMFGFAVVIQLCTCDFQLDITQKSILMSMPLIGPIITAYFWGYVSDTQGRKKSLIIGMAGAFLMSILCAFSPNWIVLAVFKLIGTCFCSSAQSATFTLLGESCPEKTKGKYLLILSSIQHCSMASYFVSSHLIGNLDFIYKLGFINFVPWRLLVLVLALPLGFSAMGLMFFYESPKFLLNAGLDEQALDVLKKICWRNCGKETLYEVKKIVLIEEGNVETKNANLWISLKDQTVPLFKPPLLLHTLVLFYLIFVVYCVSGSIFIWMPFFAQTFTSGDTDFNKDLCSLITENNTINSNNEPENCEPVNLTLTIVSIATSSIFCSLSILMAKFASRKRDVMITILAVAAASSFLATIIPNQTSGIAYMGIILANLCMGPLFAYYVDLFPTSFRGMAACLGVMVSRIGSVSGVNIVVPFITAQCTYTFYVIGAILFSGAIIAFLFLPSKSNENMK